MKRLLLSLCLLSMAGIYGMAQNKIPLFVSGNNAGKTVDNNYSVTSTFGLTVNNILIDNDNQVYFGLLGPSAITTTTEESLEMKDMVVLHPNYPNPFNELTKIPFELKRKKNIKLKVINILGETELVNSMALNPGFHTFDFKAGNLPAGIYFYQLKVEDWIDTKAMLLIK